MNETHLYSVFVFEYKVSYCIIRLRNTMRDMSKHTMPRILYK